jgi:hypothetical protein
VQIHVNRTIWLTIPELILNPSSDPSVAAVALAGIANVPLLLLDAELVSDLLVELELGVTVLVETVILVDLAELDEDEVVVTREEEEEVEEELVVVAVGLKLEILVAMDPDTIPSSTLIPTSTRRPLLTNTPPRRILHRPNDRLPPRLRGPHASPRTRRRYSNNRRPNSRRPPT